MEGGRGVVKDNETRGDVMFGAKQAEEGEALI